ncbi:hypothetical protein ChPV086 [Cheloniid poxvirus 1]|nr:hypothetical protein ChPV086 [Cheloniid poxvirus 1]
MSRTLILYNNDNNNLVSMNSVVNYNKNNNYCYFGRCSDILKYDLSYYGVYNPMEINSIYNIFLKRHNLLSMDERRLNIDIVDHIIHHFIEFLIDLKTNITHKNISKRILLKDTRKGYKSLPKDYVFL